MWAYRPADAWAHRRVGMTAQCTRAGTWVCGRMGVGVQVQAYRYRRVGPMPNLHTNIIPAKICRLQLLGKLLMSLEMSPLMIKILIESNPLKSRI